MICAWPSSHTLLGMDTAVTDPGCRKGVSAKGLAEIHVATLAFIVCGV